MNGIASQSWRILKIVLPIVIVIGVGWQFASILRRPELSTDLFSVRVEWLIPGALLYLLAHSIFATFWVQLLASQGARIPWLFGVRAYFISQFGKYVPGKAWVIVMRVAMLRAFAPSRTILALTATYETLGTMAAGAGVGVLLTTFVLQSESLAGREWMIVAIALIPLGFGLLHSLVNRIAKKYQRDSVAMPKLPFLLLVRGLLQSSVGWGLLGLSLWMTMQGLKAETSELTWDAWLRSTAIVSLSYVIGFVVLVAPGGVGVREFFLQLWLMQELVTFHEYSPESAAGFAVVVALVLRLTWTIAEMIAIFFLYRFVRPPVVEGAAL